MLIGNIKMPSNCFDCKLETLVTDCPCHLGSLNASDYKDKRCDECPLREFDGKDEHELISNSLVGGAYSRTKKTEIGGYWNKFRI